MGIRARVMTMGHSVTQPCHATRDTVLTSTRATWRDVTCHKSQQDVTLKQLLLILGGRLSVRPDGELLWLRHGASWDSWRRCKSRTFPPIFSEIIKSESVGAVTLAGSASQSGPGRAPSSHASARGRSSGSLWSRTRNHPGPGPDCDLRDSCRAKHW